MAPHTGSAHLLGNNYVEAVIFDMDGVLLDSEPLHQRALTSLLAELGHELSSDEYFGLVGLSQESTWEWLRGRFGMQKDTSAYEAEYQHRILELLKGTLTPERGAVELVRYVRALYLKLAVASSSLAPWVSATLEGLGVADAFDAVVSGDQVSAGKPDPEIFLTAARRLSAIPSRTVVIEDSIAGMEAGVRAGMKVVGLRTRYNRGKDLPAQYVVDSLEQLLPENRGD